MVLRCSLLGHDYGETDVDREREERGSEVVVTVTEYEQCTRCGKRHVISENTEVTALDDETATATATPTPPDERDSTPATQPTADRFTETTTDTDIGVEVLDDSSESERTSASSDDDVGGTDDTSARDNSGESVSDSSESERTSDSSESDTDSREKHAASAVEEDSDDSTDTDTDTDTGVLSFDEDDSTLEVPTDEHGEPITDDAEILTEEDERDDREHGQWPASEDVGPPVGADSEPAEWPETADDIAAVADGEHERDDVDTVDHADDADTTDEDEGESESEADEDTVDVPDDAVYIDADDSSDDALETTQTTSYTGFTSAQAAPTPGESGPQAGGTTEFFCPACSFVAPGDRGSLRPGDICPDCRKGYLGERER